ncbi:MAG: hypothetical protein ACE5JR_13625 [Gemmatimonadota bacterium]
MSLIIVTSCSRDAPPTPAAPVEPPPFLTLHELPRVWETPGGDEIGPMCLRLEDGGTLYFAQGFEFYNPARWEYRAGEGESVFILPTLELDSATLNAMNSYVARGTLKAFDTERRALHYQLYRFYAKFDFQGWYFLRPDSLRAAGIELITRCDSAEGLQPGA